MSRKFVEKGHKMPKLVLFQKTSENRWINTWLKSYYSTLKLIRNWHKFDELTDDFTLQKSVDPVLPLVFILLKVRSQNLFNLIDFSVFKQD
jgi:hypothetical protein